MEDEWDKLHGIIHQLHLCVWKFPPGILKDKSEQLIDCLQSCLDEYFAHCSNVGIIVPIPLFGYRKVQREAGQAFLDKVICVIETYQLELLTIGPADENKVETTFFHHILALLNCLIALIRCLIIPPPSASHFFQVSHSKQMISDIMQHFLNTSQTLIGEQESSLKFNH